MLAFDSQTPPPAASLSRGAHPRRAALARLQFDDAQEQAAALRGWNQSYLQLGAGVFRGEVCQLQGNCLRMFVERVQQSMRQTGWLGDDVLALGVPLGASGMGMFCGTSCSTDVVHMFSGPGGFEFCPPPQHTMFGIELPLPAALREGLPRQPAALRLRPAAIGALRSYLLALMGAARCKPELLSSAAVQAEVGDRLLAHLSDGDTSAPSAGGHRGMWRLVQRAGNCIQASPEQPPTVAQLCLALGVSRRTLQNSFQRVLGVGPLAFLKATRLQRAREALKRAPSVTDAATASGFWHFGHFSQDYLALFGERPSETWRRYRPR